MNPSAKMKPRVHSIASDGLELPVTHRTGSATGWTWKIPVLGGFDYKNTLKFCRESQFDTRNSKKLIFCNMTPPGGQITHSGILGLRTSYTHHSNAFFSLIMMVMSEMKFDTLLGSYFTFFVYYFYTLEIPIFRTHFFHWSRWLSQNCNLTPLRGHITHFRILLEFMRSCHYSK